MVVKLPEDDAGAFGSFLNWSVQLLSRYVGGPALILVIAGGDVGQQGYVFPGAGEQEFLVCCPVLALSNGGSRLSDEQRQNCCPGAGRGGPAGDFPSVRA